MIDARLQIEAGPEFPDENERFAAQHAELLERAAMLAAELGKDVVRLEVEYPSEALGADASWDISGDAIEIDFRGERPTIRTLPPYSEEAP